MYLITVTYILPVNGLNTMAKRTRVGNGKASLRSSNGRLQVRIRYEGYPYCLSLRLDDTPINRAKGLEICKAIDADVSIGRFDPDALDSYLPKTKKRSNVPKTHNSITTVQELWITYVTQNYDSFNQTTHLAIISPLSNKIQSFPEYKIGKDENKLIAQFAHLKITTQHNQLSRVKTAYKWGEKNNLIPKGMAELLELPKLESEDFTPPNPLSDAEVNAIFAECEKTGEIDLLNLIKFLVYTGCRPSEAFGLRVYSIDFKSKKICFQRTYNKVGGKIVEKDGTKTKRKRYFPINNQLLVLLKDVIKTNNSHKDDYVFTHNGKPWDTVALTLRWKGRCTKNGWDGNGIIPRLVRAGLLSSEYTPYNLRDTYISHCIIKGYSPSVIASWVGNSPSMIDKHYFGVLDSITSPELYS